MIYTVKRIDEDLDFGCEERPKGMPVMAIVTLTNSSGEEIRIKAEDAMLYECNINGRGRRFVFDVNNKLGKSGTSELMGVPLNVIDYRCFWKSCFCNAES